jgi:hypothetical protein
MGGVKHPLSHAINAGSNNFGTYSVDIRAAGLDKSKTAKGEEVYKHCEGALYFLNTIRFHGTQVNVISFTPGRKVRASAQFSRTSQSFRQYSVVISYIAFHPSLIINVKKEKYKLRYAPKYIMDFITSGFHGIHHNLINFLTSYVLNLIKLKRKNLENTEKISFTFLSMLITEPTFMQHTRADNQYRISPKSVTRCGKYG